MFLSGDGLEREDDEADDRDLERPIAAAAKGTAAAADAAAASLASLDRLLWLRASMSEVKSAEVLRSLSRPSIFIVSLALHYLDRSWC